MQIDAAGIGPGVERPADELGPLSVTSMAGFPRVSIERAAAPAEIGALRSSLGFLQDPR